jgi:hypothetical protein
MSPQIGVLKRLSESLSECDRRSLGGIGDPASSGRDRRSTEITDLGYNGGVFLRFLFGNRSRSGAKREESPAQKGFDQGASQYCSARFLLRQGWWISESGGVPAGVFSVFFAKKML